MKHRFLSRAAEFLAAQRRRKRWVKVVSAMAAVVVFCTTYALILPAITMEKDPVCGLEEHQHDETCYAPGTPVIQRELVCTLENQEVHQHTEECFDENGALICDIPEVQEHVHSDACFEEREVAGEPVLICGLPEHQHTADCYPHEEEEESEPEEEQPTGDPNADVETRAIWEATLPKTLTGDWAEDVITVASSQLGYAESTRNYIVLEDGSQKGYSRYGAWYGDPYGDWCAMFVSFCLHYAQVEDFPLDANCVHWIQELKKLECYAPAEEYTPRPGDLIFFDWDEDGQSDHVGLVEELKDDTLITIEGNASNRVARVKYEKDAPEILGYGILPENGEPVTLTAAIYTDERYETPAGDSTRITVTGVIPEGAQVRAFPVEVELAEETVLCAYDISIYLADGSLFEPEEPLSVRFLLPEREEETADCKVVYVPERGEPEPVQAVAEDGGVTFEAEHFSVYAVLAASVGDVSDAGIIAEAAEGTNWMRLRDSGWFEAYSSSASGSGSASAARLTSPLRIASTYAADGENSTPPSDVQVKDRGGTNTSDDGAVSVSKTISGTDLENVFDITLQVQTSMKVGEIREEPDMAVVIVMDISNTMNSDFGGTTRYAAAMTAAENFLDQFAANNSLGISKVGYVAFNTDAHQIFGLQSCSTQAQADALKNTMRTQTGAIINASGYADSHSRFTNVEAGLAMASNMLNGVTNQNKYIIFLSDGFPTTYISSGYSGYDPYDSTGRFYDRVLNKPCTYGTSYSDEAAIRARKKAADIKASGTTIFSIGVDVAGQTIQKYITQSENADGFSVVDRTGTTYEIGDASSTEAYKNWLRNSIGSGYYYDSTDSAGLSLAYNQIFEEIKHQITTGTEADWVASDPLPTVNGSTETVEFIGFYDKTPKLVSGDLTGTHTAGGENNASFTSPAIRWDLKNSGYQETPSASDGKTTYTYQLVYRVRLKNEISGFTEGRIYPTNDPTTLQYRTVEGTDGNLTVSDPKTVEFPIPSVQGYLAELTFTKEDSRGQPLAGAEFTLTHDTGQCSVCRGDGTAVTVPDQTATSDTNGTVSFANIPSGHKYTLTETRIPDGYSTDGYTYHVEVAYDKLSVTVTAADGTEREWNGEIVNNAYYALPETGGPGTLGYTLGGLAVMAGAFWIYKNQKGKRGRDGLN